MASPQPTSSNGNPIAALSLAAAGVTWFCLRSLGVLQGAHAFSTPLGNFSVTGETAQVVAAVGAFLGPQLLASLGAIPVVAQLMAFLSIPDTLSEINTKIDTVVEATKKS